MHDTCSVLAVEVTPSAGERGFRWVLHPADSISPRAAFKPVPAGYEGNPPAEFAEHGGVSAAVQALRAGGQYVTAWRERRGGGRRTLYVNVAHSHPRTTALDRALRAVRSAATLSYDELAHPHRARWDAFYRKSFLSLPDARMQRFYWIQLYKAAAAARRDAPVMATCGPWLEPTPWPNTWWNLNAQLEYWLIHGSNHLELDALTRALSEFRDNLTKEVAPAYRTDSLGIPRTTDPSLVNGAAVADGGYGVGVPGQDPPPSSRLRASRGDPLPPRSATSPGPCTTSGSATATPWTSRSCATSSSRSCVRRSPTTCTSWRRAPTGNCICPPRSRPSTAATRATATTT